MKHFKIFISSPSDVLKEREIVEDVVSKHINKGAFARDKGFYCETFRWELDTFPLIFGSPMRSIYFQAPKYQIYIGIMWKRFGTKTENAGSGTVDEFQKAFENHKKSGIPLIMFYFCDKSFRLSDMEGDKDLEQLNKVKKFKKLIDEYGLLKYYKNEEDFKDKIRNDIEGAISKLLKIIDKPDDKETDSNDNGIEHGSGKKGLDYKKFCDKFKEAAQKYIEKHENSETYKKYIHQTNGITHPILMG